MSPEGHEKGNQIGNIDSKNGGVQSQHPFNMQEKKEEAKEPGLPAVNSQAAKENPVQSNEEEEDDPPMIPLLFNNLEGFSDQH